MELLIAGPLLPLQQGCRVGCRWCKGTSLFDDHQFLTFADFGGGDRNEVGPSHLVDFVAIVAVNADPGTQKKSRCMETGATGAKLGNALLIKAVRWNSKLRRHSPPSSVSCGCQTPKR